MRPGDALWTALAVLAVVVERLAPRGGLGALIRRVAASATGRLLLALGWAFLAVHLFARIGSPPR